MKLEMESEAEERPLPEHCELCGRGEALTCHHLIPRSRHRKPRIRREHSRDELRSRVAWLCEPCHKHIHKCLSESEMAEDYDTVEALAAHPDVAKFVSWIRKKPPGFVP